MKMIYQLICALFLVATVHASGEVTFIHRPPSVSFKGSEILDESLLKDVYSAALGFTTKDNSDWTGLKIANPFHFAEAVVVLYVDGVESLGNSKGHHFPLNTDSEEDAVYYALERRVKNRYPTQNSTLMRVELSDGINSIPSSRDSESSVLPSVEYLNANVTEDLLFLSEIALLRDIIEKVKTNGVTRDGIPDVYWYVLRDLRAVWDFHGMDSDATKESNSILHNTITDLNKAFSTAYDGHVLVSVVTSDESHTRQTRSADPENTGSLNLAAEYNEMWPVEFNICLWFMVAFVMSLIAVSISFFEMDPGRDSIIYRMTSMKTMKKDN